MEQILNTYYEHNAKKLHMVVDNILRKFGGISDKDYQDFYSLANEVFVYVLDKYDGIRPFDSFLFSCLSNKIKTEITARNRIKRMGDREAVSLDTPIGDTEGVTVGDVLASDFDLDKELELISGEQIHDEKVENYLRSLTKIQRQILHLKMDGVPVANIKKILDLTDKQYEQHCNDMRSFEKMSILNIECGCKCVKEDKQMVTQTMEKSKPDKMSVSSIIKKMDKHTIRFDHPLQRESEQWNPSMKGNLISDILQANPLPELVFAEQIVNHIAIVWDLDGKQRCTNVYSFAKDGFRITKNVKRWMIEYQAPVTDADGNVLLDEGNFPIYETRKFDIRGKKYSELPEELQDRFNDYNFEIIQYLNCTSEDIAYHIDRYNQGRPMTAPQKGIIKLGEKYASRVKAISHMDFFRDIGGYKVSEARNGKIDRVVIESVMCANYTDDWKTTQDEICTYLKDHANDEVFDAFENMVTRLEKVVTDEVAAMFDSKDSFLLFGLFARFIKLDAADNRFVEFLAEFSRSLHTKKINGVSFDDMNGRSTKDKSVVTDKMKHLEALMMDFLGADKADYEISDIADFVQDTVGVDTVDDEALGLYEDCLDSLTLDVDNHTSLLDEQNHPSLLAIVAYACIYDKDQYIQGWMKSFFEKNRTYIKNQKQNFTCMKKDFESYCLEAA